MEVSRKKCPPKNFYPRIKIFSNCIKNFCPTLKIFFHLVKPCLEAFYSAFSVLLAACKCFSYSFTWFIICFIIFWLFSGDSWGNEDPVSHSGYWVARLMFIIACFLMHIQLILQERCLLCDCLQNTVKTSIG